MIFEIWGVVCTSPDADYLNVTYLNVIPECDIWHLILQTESGLIEANRSIEPTIKNRKSKPSKLYDEWRKSTLMRLSLVAPCDRA